MPVKTGYKLFEQDEYGNLYPLFIGKNNIIPQGVWLPAEDLPSGKLAHRPGWHIGEIPDAPWLKSHDGSLQGYYKGRRKSYNRVWCLVAYNDDRNYDDLARKYSKGYMTDRIPEGGCYRFKEAGNRLWIIAGEMMIIRVLSEEERQDILYNMGYDEIKAYEPYRLGDLKRRQTKHQNNL